jgi:hypothetical protein
MIKTENEGQIVEFNPRQISNYDPHKGLKGIAVAEAAERLFARAKDTEQLYEAIKAKLQAQRDFVLWWESQEKLRVDNHIKSLPVAALLRVGMSL